MRIDDLRADHLGTTSAKPAAPVRRGAPVTPAPAVDANARGDSVEISEQAKALAAGAEREAVRGALDPERLAELRRWLAGGGHNDPAVLRQVAGKLLASGELNDNRAAEGSEA